MNQRDIITYNIFFYCFKTRSYSTYYVQLGIENNNEGKTVFKTEKNLFLLY